MIKAVIIGATGRMGQALVRAARESSGIRIVAAVAPEGSRSSRPRCRPDRRSNDARASVTSDLRAALAASDVAIDFSQPEATAAHLGACRAAGKPLLIGTTGYPESLQAAFVKAARDIPLLVAPNTSIAMSLLIELVRACARALPSDFDIEIVDTHHRYKKDAPSGTALALGRVAAKARGRELKDVAVMNRTDGAARGEGEIGFSAIRGGDVVGEHAVHFAAPGEQLSSLTGRPIEPSSPAAPCAQPLGSRFSQWGFTACKTLPVIKQRLRGFSAAFHRSGLPSRMRVAVDTHAPHP